MRTAPARSLFHGSRLAHAACTLSKATGFSWRWRPGADAGMADVLLLHTAFADEWFQPDAGGWCSVQCVRSSAACGCQVLVGQPVWRLFTVYRWVFRGPVSRLVLQMSRIDEITRQGCWCIATARSSALGWQCVHVGTGNLHCLVMCVDGKGSGNACIQRVVHHYI